MRCHIYNVAIDKFFTGFERNNPGDPILSTWERDEIIAVRRLELYGIVCNISIYSEWVPADFIVVDEKFNFRNPLWMPDDGLELLEEVL